MADSTRWLKDLEQQLQDAGGHFLGFSANQHRKWQIGPQMIVLPNAEIHARISRHSRKNTEGTVKRAIRKHGKWPELAEAHRAATLDRWAEADRRLAEPEPEILPPPPEPTPLDRHTPQPEPEQEEPMVAATPKKYRCAQCGKTFQSKNHFAVHVRFQHPKPKTAKPDVKPVEPGPPVMTRDDRLIQLEGMISLLFRRLEGLTSRLEAMESAISMAGAALSGTRRG